MSSQLTPLPSILAGSRQKKSTLAFVLVSGDGFKKLFVFI